ncbi:uncharacterized protein CMU_030170 [Cryptosporidium muris RN66]|uniref:Uncharacterized protein n=1 Tax=Cryptosporidium muris (strain RN66) TaxID=441375 RepID=B6AIA0_CRYMR|nr:uncharacterized protein CMU_030170 [Cryptosporidium muris RN66]EEA07941.1 hypothetical protein, conserved [Cryptosporidium muris RN66]|eukprot:XP_002142290.1 hypothetical protein [Cryptosporidium muris RN66]
MDDTESMKSLVGLIHKVETKRKKRDWEKYREISSKLYKEIDISIKEYKKNQKILENEIIKETLSENMKEDNEIEETNKKLKNLYILLQNKCREFEKKKRILNIKIQQSKSKFNDIIEKIDNEERIEMKRITRYIRNILINTKKQAYIFSKNSISYEESKLSNALKEYNKI